MNYAWMPIRNIRWGIRRRDEIKCMRSKVIIILLLLSRGLSGQGLEEGFLHPPASARPWVFWYWMNAAVSKEGVRADLAAMKQAGIGGAYLMPINDVANPPLYTPALRQLSPEWWKMVVYAMQVADSLGLQLAMHDCDGFAVAGGPWITPELSMQKVVWTHTTTDGGRQVDLALPQPPMLENYYHDLAVLAFPSPAGWDQSTRNVIPRVTTSSGAAADFLIRDNNKESFKCEDSGWVQYAFDQPFTCRTIVIHSVNNYQSQRLLVEVSDDGVHFHSAGRLTPPRHGWQDGDAPVTHTIATVTARYFRFVYDKAGSEPGAEDLDAAKWKPSLKINGIELSARPAVEGFEGKSGEVWRVSPAMTKEQLPDSLCVPLSSVIDLSDKMDAAGHLVWTPPPGHWTVLRIGHTSTGHTNATGGGGKGLECDKFNPQAVKLQFDKWFGEAFRQAGPALAGRVLKIFHVDSWECGSQNWSPVFREEFKRRRGYDLLRWLPAMAGIPLSSADSSEKFLHDVRQTIAELLHDNFYVTMAALAHAKGCSFSAESVAPTMTSDGMLHYSAADIPMGEFWLRSPTHDKPNDMLDAISGGHIYGKPIIQAEAFTELREAWDETPAMLKPLQDRNYALGVNRMVFHVFMHNPWMDRKPGMTLGGVGTFLQRDQTWWPSAKAWIDYTQRCQWLLQQGSPVADLAVFTGEELPRRAVLPERLVSTLPGLFGKDRVEAEQVRLNNSGTPVTKAPNGVAHAENMADPADWIDPLHGYAYDSFNPDALLRLAKVQGGRVVFPGGASYAMLVFPGPSPFSPDPGSITTRVAQRVLELVKEGATVLIDSSLAHSALHELLDGHFKGRIIKSPFEAPSLSPLHIAPDFMAGEYGLVLSHPDAATGNPAGIAYVHRSAPGLDIYFVSNQSALPLSLEISLRMTGRQPEIWDPVTGNISTVSAWEDNDGRTRFRTYMAPHGSFFIVLRKPAKAPGLFTWLKPVEPGHSRVIKKLPGPWTVRFDPKIGGPAKPVSFDSLTDWSRNADTAIRYYSGTAAYSQSFTWNGATGGKAWLELSQVGDLASVTLNGIDCGTAWTPPYQLNISHALRPGVNTLQISVTNTWNNRIVADQRLPENKRLTWTTAPYHLDGKLLPAGLMGDVRIIYNTK